jgi:hypothetical protein
MSSNHTNIFTSNEEDELKHITKEYRRIFENATFLSLQMEKIKEEMNELMNQTNDIREKESAIYLTVVERSGLTLEEVQKESGSFALAEAMKLQKS